MLNQRPGSCYVCWPIRSSGCSLSLRAYYSAADLMVVPSRQDNLPNTAVEAHACGTPVVAFHTGGLPDIVEHKRTGYLAQPFHTQDLAAGISWVLEDTQRRIGLGHAARQRARAALGSGAGGWNVCGGVWAGD